ncbi:MAG: hypothetical protein JXA30_13435 [Deltaproteobacteria bacterium]|nr:hypothetical protein [Deltaproteobacteria bacterium]
MVFAIGIVELERLWESMILSFLSDIGALKMNTVDSDYSDWLRNGEVMKDNTITERGNIVRFTTVDNNNSNKMKRLFFAIAASLLVSLVLSVGCSDSDEITPQKDAAEDEDASAIVSEDDSAIDKPRADASIRPNDAAGPDHADAMDRAEGQDAGCVYSGPPLVDLEQLEPCSLCDNARCFSAELVDSEYRDELADCEDGVSKCVPDLYLETGGKFILKSCVSLLGAEGRCLSLCIPAVAEMKEILPIDECQSDERCAPCFDLITGDDTGSCSISCDPGPSERARTFSECCDGVSVCIPEDLVPSEDRPNFDENDCEEKGMLCIPKEMASDPDGYVPQPCESWDGAEGRCLPACLPEVANQADWLTRDRCPAGFICDPCFDPRTGDETGACRIAGDPGPEEDVYSFPECCGGLSLCIPEEAVPEEDRDQLTRDSCSSKDALCVPKGLASEPTTFVAQVCSVWGGAEGRCLPECLPEVAKSADRLERADCPDGHLCTPCTDPVTGEATDACALGGDTGPQDDPYTFAECCDGLSVCIPREIIPEADQDRFGSVGCADTDALCVPKEIATAPTTYKATPCTSWKGAEGRCLPGCLPDVVEVADRLSQDICADGYLCVPCTDQITGDSTSACSIGADEPTRDPVLFDRCCDGLSVCSPEEAVPETDRSLFGTDSCQGTDLCVPIDIATDDYVPTPCLSWNNAEARCLPACLPNVAANAARIERGSCDEKYLCVPCYDHVSLEDTRACSIGGGDAPQQDYNEYIFPECCGGNSVCAPPEAVADDKEVRFNRDTCGESEELCVPKNIALDPTGYGATQTHCTSWGGGEGRCVAACVNDVIEVAATLKQDIPDLYEDGCDTGSLCVPCYDPLTGLSTGACTEAGDSPTQQPPYRFPGCCLQDEISRGTCIPSALVPDDKEESLIDDNADENDCVVDGQIDEDFLCVPNELTSDPNLLFPSDCVVTRLVINLDDPVPGLCMAACFSPVPPRWIEGTCEGEYDECLPCELYGEPAAPCIEN